MKGVQLQGFEIDPLQVTLRTWDENLDYEDAFLRYFRAFDSSLTDEQLEECWSQAVSELEETPYNEDVYAIVMKGDETLIGFTTDPRVKWKYHRRNDNGWGCHVNVGR